VNIQEYISSGIIEAYVLGLASAEKRVEFEHRCTQYPELVEARKQFEEAIERQARENAPAPPAFLREKIWSEIQQSSSKIITMEPTTRRSTGLGWVAAASIILLLAAGYFAFKFYNESKVLKKNNDELTARANRTDSILNRIVEEQKAINNPNTIVVNLVATQKAQPSSASIYWDSTSSNVFMVVKNMPKLPSDKQYQLWALIDGKPKDLGLFDATEPNVILKMNNTQKADAFAITVENRGNTAGPTLEQLQSMGKTKL
jgi:anti-sigma-K factor RskA